MKILLLTLLLNIPDTTSYKDTIVLNDMKLVAQLKTLWIKHPLENQKTPTFIYKPKTKENDSH